MGYTKGRLVARGHTISSRIKGAPTVFRAELHASTAYCITDQEAEANAHRIAACWNACAGMADPATEIADLRAKLASVTDAVSIMHTAFAGYADTAAKVEAIAIAAETLARIQEKS